MTLRARIKYHVIEWDDTTGTEIPHSDFGGGDCCGCLVGMPKGENAEIVCNECGAVVRTIPSERLRGTLDAVEISLSMAAVKCQHCGSVSVFPGFRKITAFKECGKGNVIPAARALT